MTTSVLTLVRGREAHLRNLMKSIAEQSVKPAELVIAWMQDAAFAELPDPGCPRRDVFVPGDPMPLAQARNEAAKAACGDLLVFLDVDCIASTGLVAAFEAAAGAAGGLFLGEVLYLPAGAVGDTLDFDALDRLGKVHPSKPPVPANGIRIEPDAGELWGLSFALKTAHWRAVGGMDEAFVGYGGEETDFAWRVAAHELPTYWTGNARAYHQHHAVAVPPLHQFEHILRNAQLFREKHGRWCMDYWLGQFRDLGLIGWDEEADAIELVRSPRPDEIAASLKDEGRLFS